MGRDVLYCELNGQITIAPGHKGGFVIDLYCPHISWDRCNGTRTTRAIEIGFRSFRTALKAIPEVKSRLYQCELCDQYTEQELIDGLCHDCYRWLTIEEGSSDMMFFADGNYYQVKWIGVRSSNDPFLGFAGAKFDITLPDGRRIETNNLWHIGQVPARFLKLYPDNGIIHRRG